MVEHNQEDRDKMKANREKKIKRVRKENADLKRIDQDLRDVAKGKIDPNDFDESHDI